MEEYTLALAMEQLLNTFVQGAFAYPVWKLAQTVGNAMALRQEVQ